MNVLGIMSGTSLDGVDYALCSISNSRIRLRHCWHVAFPKSLRTRLDQAAQGLGSSHEAAQLHHDLGRFYAQKAAAAPRKISVDLAGLHGQTIFHHPSEPPATFQLGEPAYLAQALNVSVVSNFRAADLAAGGEGAPLATLFHQFAFGRRGRHICIQNLGGIANVTSVDWSAGSRHPHVLAFDTGPANMLMDLAIRHFTKGNRSFDLNGAWARRGKICERLLAQWMKHPFLKRKPPKSTGRELFGEPFLKSALNEMKKDRLTQFDQLATLAEFSARSVALNYSLHISKPHQVILSGGGALNRYLAGRIEFHLKQWHRLVQVTTTAQLGWPPQTIEAAAFAFLAYRRYRNQPGNVPATTGARHAVVLGQIT